MSRLFLAVFAVLTTFSILAQAPAPPEKNDPEAKKVLDRIRKKYDAYKTMEANFSLTIEVPERPKDLQKGIIAQEGNKFCLEMSDQTIVSDGKTTWVYQKKSNEVQINDADPNDVNAFLTPKDLLRRYEKGDFLYAITDKVAEKNKVLTMIEFKPKDRSSEYAKFRLAVDEKAGTIESIKAFAKDGSRYTFLVTSLSTNKPLPQGRFSFDPQRYKGVRVEDLRL